MQSVPGVSACLHFRPDTSLAMNIWTCSVGCKYYLMLSAVMSKASLELAKMTRGKCFSACFPLQVNFPVAIACRQDEFILRSVIDLELRCDDCFFLLHGYNLNGQFILMQTNLNHKVQNNKNQMDGDGWIQTIWQWNCCMLVIYITTIWHVLVSSLITRIRNGIIRTSLPAGGSSRFLCFTFSFQHCTPPTTVPSSIFSTSGSHQQQPPPPCTLFFFTFVRLLQVSIGWRVCVCVCGYQHSQMVPVRDGIWHVWVMCTIV